MSTSQDVLAIVGYALLLGFSTYKLSSTFKRPVDLVANLLLLTGLVSLIAYHIRSVTTKKTEADDDAQKKLRLTAHSTLTAFLLATLSPLSAARFQLYDWFALAGHSSLFVSVLQSYSQLFGIAMLALYFIFATVRKVGMRGPEMANFIGRGLMAVFFIIAFLQGAGLA